MRYTVLRRHDADRDWYDVVDTGAGQHGRCVVSHRRRDVAERDADVLNSGDDHSASRRVDVLAQEAPHLIAPLEPGSHDA